MFYEKNDAEDEKSCFHIRFDQPSGYGEKKKDACNFMCARRSGNI